MRILETFTIPQAPYLALRWVRGSGLQGRENHLYSLRLAMRVDPAYGTRIVGKPGYCLVLGDMNDRSIEVRDPLEQVNPRVIDLVTLAAAIEAGNGTGTGTGAATGTGTGSGNGAVPAAIGAAAALQDLALYETQHKIHFGMAGGIRGRCSVTSNTYLPWVLVTAVYPHPDGEQRFITQADDKGEFAIDLIGIKRPDDNGKLALTLTVEARPNLKPTEAPDPAAFIAYRISPDGTSAHLGTSISVTLDRYGETARLGDVLIAPTN